MSTGLSILAKAVFILDALTATKITNPVGDKSFLRRDSVPNAVLSFVIPEADQ